MSDQKDIPGVASLCRRTIATVGTIARLSRTVIPMFRMLPLTPRTPTETVLPGCIVDGLWTEGYARRLLSVLVVAWEAIMARAITTATPRVPPIGIRRFVWPIRETIANGIPGRIFVTRHVVVAAVISVTVAQKTIRKFVRFIPARPRVWPGPKMAVSVFGTKAPRNRFATLTTVVEAVATPKEEERKVTKTATTKRAASRKTATPVVVHGGGTLSIGYTHQPNRGTISCNGVGTTTKHHKSG